MIVTSHSPHVFSVTSGKWRISSLSDGHLDMRATLLRDTQDRPVLQEGAKALHLSVNCFALAGPGVDGILIDSGGGGWSPTGGRLERTLAEAGVDPKAISVLVLTHTHQDHVHGLLTPDGRVLLPKLQAIVIPEAAVESFHEDAKLTRFRSLLKPIRKGEEVAERLRAVDLPGHAPGHTGYAFDTAEEGFLFFGDIVHVPAMQFDNPVLSWGYDDDQPMARATRLKVFRDAAKARTWIAGAHLGWPGIGRVTRKGDAYAYEPPGG